MLVGGLKIKVQKLKAVLESVSYSRGTPLYEYVTSRDINAYPEDGKQGEYWYLLRK